jgi:hypothetical protein
VRTVPADYFGGPVFAAPAAGELFRAHTCTACGHRAVTWAAFRVHRPECSGRLPDAFPLPLAAGRAA